MMFVTTAGLPLLSASYTLKTLTDASIDAGWPPAVPVGDMEDTSGAGVDAAGVLFSLLRSSDRRGKVLSLDRSDDRRGMVIGMSLLLCAVSAINGGSLEAVLCKKARGLELETEALDRLCLYTPTSDRFIVRKYLEVNLPAFFVHFASFYMRNSRFST